MEKPVRSTSLFGYQAGDVPNVPLLFVGYCCCCGVSGIMQLHNSRTELKRLFPELDDSNHWLSVLIAIWALLRTDAQLTDLEKRLNIQYTPTIPPILTLVVPFLWPIAEAEMMKRLNVLMTVNGRQ